MRDWLVITAEHPHAGRGVRGLSLIKFLRTYFGLIAVGAASPSAVRRRPRTARTIFLGLPTPLTPAEIESLAARPGVERLVPFDYLDQHELAWTPEQETVLRRLSNVYLKAWFEPAWEYNLRMGMLPLRRYGRFTTALVLERALRRLVGRPKPIYDVGFLGQPNRTRFVVDGKIEKVSQRTRWLLDIRRQAPELKFWGGFGNVSENARTKIRAVFGDCEDVSSLFLSYKKLSFLTYWKAMRSCRVLLAPGGNVPWSYRHYECVYAGAAVVTIDFRERDMLVPLPREGMVHVPDGAPVMPAVREALDLYERRPTLGEENYARLEEYFRFGHYSRGRQKLLDRFLDQLL